MVTIADLGMAIGGLVMIVGINIVLVLTSVRMFLITQKFQGSGALRNMSNDVVSFVFSVQPLHLQTSKVSNKNSSSQFICNHILKTRVVNIKGCWYPGPEYQEWLFRENLVAHIVISFMR